MKPCYPAPPFPLTSGGILLKSELLRALQSEISRHGLASVSLRDCVNLPTFDPAIPVVSVNHVSRARSRTRSNDVRNCPVSNHFVNHVAGKPHVCHRFLWSQKSFLPRGRRRLFVPLLKAHVRSANRGAIYPKTRIVTRINGTGLQGTIRYW